MKAIIENISIILLVGVILGIVINIIFRIRAVSTTTKSIINDTLKKDGKWSFTRIVMASAWAVVMWSFHYNIIKNGFDLISFSIMAGIALTGKIPDAYSKKLNPDTPKDDTTGK